MKFPFECQTRVVNSWNLKYLNHCSLRFSDNAYLRQSSWFWQSLGRRPIIHFFHIEWNYILQYKAYTVNNWGSVWPIHSPVITHKAKRYIPFNILSGVQFILLAFSALLPCQLLYYMLSTPFLQKLLPCLKKGSWPNPGLSSRLLYPTNGPLASVAASKTCLSVSDLLFFYVILN